jgi:hypothetical protein
MTADAVEALMHEARGAPWRSATGVSAIHSPGDCSSRGIVWNRLGRRLR